MENFEGPKGNWSFHRGNAGGDAGISFGSSGVEAAGFGIAGFAMRGFGGAFLTGTCFGTASIWLSALKKKSGFLSVE